MSAAEKASTDLAVADERETLIEAKDLGKQYKLFARPLDRLKEVIHPFGKRYHTEFFALRHLGFSVKRGEILAIVGRNGSGKSTLLKMVTGILAPTEGTLNVKGRIAALLELGAGFNPEYTGVENVYLNGTIHGLTREEVDKKLPEILAFADIGDFAYRQCKSYSSGMFARLAFAAMIHFEPDILIVDEALAVGDVFFQQKCNRWMKEKMAGVTKLLVTHDMASVAALATRAIVLDSGRLTFDGPPLEAIEHFTKSLHTDLFASEEKREALPENTEALPEEDADTKFVPVAPDSLGGAREVSIAAWHVSVNRLGAEVVKSGDTVRVALKITADRAVEHLIVGVSVADKYGQSIFGVNSLASGHGPLPIEKGASTISLEFEWPEIKEGSYFLTLGLGEGLEELNHVVQCWAHNVIALTAIPGRAIHGLFNVPMRRLSATR